MRTQLSAFAGHMSDKTDFSNNGDYFKIDNGDYFKIERQYYGEWFRG